MMNDLIKELARQSGVVYDWDPGTSGPEVYFDRQEDFEKFAELIIRECVAHLNFVGDEYAGIELLEHFGVQE
jgi:hypothetical protein